MKKKIIYIGLILLFTTYSHLCRSYDDTCQEYTNPTRYHFSDDYKERSSSSSICGMVSPISPETVEARKNLYDIYNEIDEVSKRGIETVYPNSSDKSIYKGKKIQ